MGFIKKEDAIIWLVDVQENLFPHVESPSELLQGITFVLEWAKILEIPIIATEQAPTKLGPLLPALQKYCQKVLPKTCFSGWGDPKVREAITQKTILLVGIESHICVLQAAKELKEAGRNVVVLADAVSSRNLHDHHTALEEMRAEQIRVSTAETVLYELIGDANDPRFSKILPLVKSRGSCSKPCC
jgi:nicotinamidase-related amidase